MKINVNPQIMLKLMTCASISPDEFSGFGFCRLEGEIIHVYDFELLDVGSYSFTEIPAEKIVKLSQRPDAKNMRVWIHRHPVGNGIPGEHNWSGTDQNTIMTNPMGSIPEMVRWSVSMVLTPLGWVGRIDNYISKQTRHLNVEPQFREIYTSFTELEKTREIITDENKYMLGTYLMERMGMDYFDMEEIGLIPEDLVDIFDGDIDILRAQVLAEKEEALGPHQTFCTF